MTNQHRTLIRRRRGGALLPAFEFSSHRDYLPGVDVHSSISGCLHPSEHLEKKCRACSPLSKAGMFSVIPFIPCLVAGGRNQVPNKNATIHQTICQIGQYFLDYSAIDARCLAHPTTNYPFPQHARRYMVL